MVNEISQVGLIMLVIMPGYISYTFKEMWSIHREKTQFEKLLNSIAFSIIIWGVFWSIFEKTPRYYLAEGSISKLVSRQGVVLLIVVFLLSLIMTLVEKSRLFFKFGRLVGISIKEEHNYSLFDYIFNRTNRYITEVYVYTEDGSIYRGLSRKEKGWELYTGTHPYSGNISFACDWSKKPGEEKGESRNPEDEHGYITRTYIPKERIKKIRYRISKDKH